MILIVGNDGARLGINSILSIFARGFELITLVIIHVMLTRYIGAHDFGLYAFAISYIMVFYPIVDLGMDHIFVREINKNRNRTNELFYSTIFLKLTILFPTIIIIAVGIFFISPERNLFWGIIIEGIATLLIRQFLSFTARAFFVAFEELKYDLILTIVSQMTKVIILFVVVFWDLGFIAVFFVILGGDSAYGLPGILIALARYYKKREGNGRKFRELSSFDIIGKTKNMLRESFPIGLTLILITASFHVDVFIIKAFLSDERNGVFAAAYRIIATLISCSIPIIWVMMPVLSRSVKTNTITHELQKGVKFIIIASIPLITILYFYAYQIVSFFGKDFAESAKILRFLAPVLVFRFVAYLFDLGLIAMDKQRITIIGAATLFFLNFTLDILLIKPLGIYGACVGTLSSDIAVCVLLYLLIKRNIKGLTIIKVTLKPLAVGLVLVLGMYFLRPYNSIFAIFASLALYCCGIYFFKVLDKSEIAFFEDLLGNFLLPKRK
ncbi:oligosaccharide flippase family protein [bacterium]|nr:oligosaccharide flippase family protein [bacterium]